MKKIRNLSLVMCLVLIVTVFAGCVRSNNVQPNNIPQQSTEEKQPVNNTGESFTPITADEAKAIALEKAGLTAEEVKFDRVEYDRDNGVEYYEVEFRKGFTEYSADIAMDGTIIGWEMDND